MGYVLVTAVLVVSLGRLGDMMGRVRIYNLGFVIFTAASIALSLDPAKGAAGAMWLIAFRLVQATGGSMLMANSAAILTDAFPADQRGMALGVNQIMGLSGQFVGLVAGGLLAAWDWRAVFWVNVPFGVFGTIWAYRKLARDLGAGPGADRLVGQPDLRPGSRLDPDLHHLRHPALPPRHHGVEQPEGRRRAACSGGCLLALFGVIETRVAPTHVQPQAVPHPGLRGRIVDGSC